MDIAKVVRAMMGKPEIYFANMGHGEAIAFEINGQWYLRDFGESSSKRDDEKQCCVNKILTSCCSQECIFNKLISQNIKCDVIVSHCHSDHICGFERLFNERRSKIFRNAFMPIQYLQKNIIDQKCFLHYIEANLHIFCFAKQRKYRSNAQAFLTMPLIMSTLADRVHYLYSDSRNCAFPGTVYCPTGGLALDDLSNGYDIEKNLGDYYRLNSIKDTSSERFRNTASEIYEIIKKYIDNDTKTNVEESAPKDYKSILHKINELKKESSAKSRNVRILQYFVKGSIDDRSLVFDVAFPGSTEINVLFLGDNNDTSLRRLIRNFKKHYDFIKADHHGSRGGKVLKNFFDISSSGSKVITTVCCCGAGHRSGTVNPEYNDMSKRVLWTEKKPTWNNFSSHEVGNCKISPHDL
ncbi:MAG: hypothetical protein J6Y54_02105 [Lentisphaeria bacterium]|nr:hypothetical protein [Lentisphaeria bacterium]